MSNFYGYASAPSNIALLKYWGKNSDGMPLNPSISMTLGDLRSFTKVVPNKIGVHEFFLNGIELEIDEKLSGFIKRILSFFRCNNTFTIESINNFPTSAGIASSASGYAALAAAFVNFFTKAITLTPDHLNFLKTFCKFGSKSSLRSLSDNSAKFIELKDGKTNEIKCHESLKDLTDFVLCIDKSQKKISSSDGHKYAGKSIFNNIRVEYANHNAEILKNAIQDGDFNTVQNITEADAILMHASVAETFNGYTYLSHATETIIIELLKNRSTHKIMWTCDAGANVHLLFPKDEISFVDSFLIHLKDYISFEIFSNKTSTGIKLGDPT